MLLLNDGTTKDETREYLSIIKSECGRLEHFCENTLLLSRLNREQLLTGKTLFNITELIRKVLIMLQSKWEEKHITLNLTMPGVKYYGRKDLISKVLLNILTNAIKHTNDRG